jgi:hypothetical protein
MLRVNSLDCQQGKRDGDKNAVVVKRQQNSARGEPRIGGRTPGMPHPAKRHPERVLEAMKPPKLLPSGGRERGENTVSEKNVRLGHLQTS